MSKIYLRVKIRSLEAEAGIIRHEERRRQYRKVKTPDGKIRKRRVVSGDTVFWGLRTHRTEEVRQEARSAHLAYAYLRGRPYREAENNPLWLRNNAFLHTKPDLARIAELVLKFGSYPFKHPKEAVVLDLDGWVNREPEVKTALAA